MRRLSRLGAAALALALTGCAPPAAEPGHRDSRSARPGHSRSGSPTPAVGEPRTALGGQIRALLDTVDLVERDPYHPGYDRSCAPGHGCVFGAAWTDDHPGPRGHNGCDTRQDVLLAQLRRIEMRWGSSCRVYDGELVDPYSGERLTWRDDGYWIQIDHVFPLARAWHAGAWAWPRARRLRLANDVQRELLAVSARANQDKGASGLSQWLPPAGPLRCRYVVRYLRVAAAYRLPITVADADAARRTAPGC